MAIINVTTVDQFLTAYTQAVAAGDTEDTIEIMADIDFNTDPLTTSYLAGGKKIINGNFHSLSNISTQNVVSNAIFRAPGTSEITWNKVNFLNLYRNENYVFFVGGQNNETYYQKFFDCTFQGKGYRLANYCNFTRCTITWQNTQALSNSFGGCNFEYCWIDCDMIKTSGSNYDFGRLTNSYLNGKITGANGVTDGWHLCNGLENSVINVDTDLNYSRGLMGSSTITTVSVYNTTRMTGTIATQTNVIGVSDTDMHSAAALAAAGFNIIV